MKLTFRIEYRTAWGEMLGATLCGNDNQPIMLSTGDGIRWEGSAEMTDAPAGIPYLLPLWSLSRRTMYPAGKWNDAPHFLSRKKKKLSLYLR